MPTLIHDAKTDAPAARASAAARPWLGWAAAVVIAFGIGLNLPRWRAGPVATTPAGGLVARGPLADGLEHDLAASPLPGASVAIAETFQANDGRWCRTFVLRAAQPIAGLACRSGDAWRILAVADARPPLAGAYETAASETPAVIQDEAARQMKGAPLDANSETQAAKAGWRAGG